MCSCCCTASEGGLLPARSAVSKPETRVRRLPTASLALTHESEEQVHEESAAPMALSTREWKASQLAMSTGGLAKAPIPEPQTSLAFAASSGQELPPAAAAPDVAALVPVMSAGLASHRLRTLVQRKKIAMAAMMRMIRFFMASPLLHERHVREGRDLVLDLGVVADDDDGAAVRVEVPGRRLLEVGHSEGLDLLTERLQEVAREIIRVERVDPLGQAGLGLDLELHRADAVRLGGSDLLGGGRADAQPVELVEHFQDGWSGDFVAHRGAGFKETGAAPHVGAAERRVGITLLFAQVPG